MFFRVIQRQVIFTCVVYEYQWFTILRSSFFMFFSVSINNNKDFIYSLLIYSVFSQSLWFILLLTVWQDPINDTHLVSVIWCSTTIICQWRSWIVFMLKYEDRVLVLEQMKIPLRQRTKLSDQAFFRGLPVMLLFPVLLSYCYHL